MKFIGVIPVDLERSPIGTKSRFAETYRKVTICEVKDDKNPFGLSDTRG